MIKQPKVFSKKSRIFAATTLALILLLAVGIGGAWAQTLLDVGSADTLQTNADAYDHVLQRQDPFAPSNEDVETVTVDQVSYQLLEITNYPLLWPSPTSNVISAPYSDVRNHTCIDILAEEGSAVIASLDGEVIEHGYDSYYGNYLWVDCGEYRLHYGALQELYVETGDTISAGDEIAAVGNTGASTGAHLHFAVYDKKGALNPIALMTVPTLQE